MKGDHLKVNGAFQSPFYNTFWSIIKFETQYKKLCTCERVPKTAGSSMAIFKALWIFLNVYDKSLDTKNICTCERGPNTVSSRVALFKALLINDIRFENLLKINQQEICT